MVIRKFTYEQTRKTVNGIEYKLCYDCEKWFEMNEDNFYHNKSNGKDGFYNVCKSCNIIRSAKSQEARRDQTILYKRHWYRQHRKTEAEKAKERYQDPEKREIKLQRARDFRKNNPEKLREYSRNHPNHNISKEEWDACKAYFNYMCAYCGLYEEFAKALYGQGLHKEHVIPGGRNDLKNCVPACLQCNSEKNIHSLHTWYNESNPKYSRYRYMKIVEWLKGGCRRSLKEASQ